MTISPIETTRRPTPIEHLVHLGEQATAANILRRSFYGSWLAGDQPCLRSAAIDRSIAIGPSLPARLWLERTIVDDSNVVAVARGVGATVMVDVESATTFVRVTAETDAEADALLDELVTTWQSAPAEDMVDLHVWNGGAHGGTRQKCQVTARGWDDVSHNYPAPCRAQLDRLMRTIRPDRKGKLILWHGPPGTGKTSAIRTLARTWAPWCGTQYIADPEQLFGDPNYLIRVLRSAPDPRSQPTLTTAGERNQAWQLIVAEDSDEYLRSRSEGPTGGALGRILNLTDGLLGQSYNALLLLTTNEDIARLHPALIRPGRCLARVPFEPFTATQATEWLGRAGSPASGSMTLADLLLTTGELEMIDTAHPDAQPTGMYL